MGLVGAGYGKTITYLRNWRRAGRAAIISPEPGEAAVTATKKLVLMFIGTFIFLFTNPFSGAQATPQTARQALLDMFFSKTPGTFETHLPQATVAALRKAGANSGASMLTLVSALTAKMNTQGQQLQTFEAGPTLVLIENPQARSKFEIRVERDDLRGDEDEIELSFHGTKDGETQSAGVKFRLTITMKQETGSWRLNEITMALGVGLTDPDFLKAMTTNIKPAASTMGGGDMRPSVASTPGSMSTANEAAAVGGVRTLNTAEVTYSATFPGRGFTCTLSDLGGMGAGGGPTEHQAMLIDPRLAAGKKNGYVFALSGCNGSPAARYTITAVPADPGSGRRAFCSDESAPIRFSPDGKGESCLTMGRPLQ
jgi:type IV pilus assembly protein PilA